MAYIYEMPVSNGIAITLSTEHDLEQEVFNVGDSIVFDCTIRNTNALAASASETLISANTLKSVEFAIKSPAQSASDNPLSTSVLFSGNLRPAVGTSGGGVSQKTKTLSITFNQCQYNNTVGGIAKIRLGIKTLMGSNKTDIYRFGATVSINDPTVAPLYTGFSPADIIDANGHKDRFGYLIQGQSKAHLEIIAANIDTGTDDAPSGAVSMVRISVTAPDGERYGATDSSASGGVFELKNAIKSDIPGDYLCELSITGAYGKTSTYSMNYTVLPYNAPSIVIANNPLAKRFRAEQDDAGGTIYTEAPDGNNILLSFIGNVQPYNGLNTFDVSVKYGVDGTDEMTDQGIVASGTDAYIIVYSYQDSIGFLPKDIFSVDNRYQLDVTITDYFGQSATITGYVDKAIFRFRVAENGVAVGMNTTGTAEHKKFEVADTHESHFYGGIAGVTNYPAAGVEELTGGKWIDGKAIYRFLWQGTTTHKKTQKVMTNFPNDITPDTVISLTGMLKRSDGEWMPIPNAYYGNSDHTANLRTYEGNGIYLGLGDGFDGTKTVVIIAEYTK